MIMNDLIALRKEKPHILLHQANKGPAISHEATFGSVGIVIRTFHLRMSSKLFILTILLFRR